MRPLVGSHQRLGGVHWAVGWGSPEKKLGAGGGGGAGWMAGAVADRQCGLVSGRAGRCGGAGRPRAVVSGGSAGGGWQLRGGVEFDDKLEALDFVSNGWKI